jgi:hypothetical protein
MRIGQRPKHNRIHQTENGGISADSEGERGNGSYRNARASSQNPKSMTKVLEHGNHVAHGLPSQMAMSKDILDLIIHLRGHVIDSTR